MNWYVFAGFAYLFTVLQVGLKTLITPRVGWLPEAYPEMLLILLVFICLNSPPRPALWAAFILGLIADLIQPITINNPAGLPELIALPGPHTLGYLAAGYVVLQMRGILYRISPLATGVAAFTACVAAGLISIALWSLRGLPFTPGEPRLAWLPSDALVLGFFNALYTLILAMILHGIFQLLTPIWRFRTPIGPSRRK